MKYIYIFIPILLSSHSIGQTVPLVEYKEGSHKLNHFLTMAFMKCLDSAYSPEVDTNVQYFQVLFSVDSSGKIGDQIIVSSVGDTANIPALLIRAIRKTDGMWINHAGRTIWVEQSFSHRYMDPGKAQPLLPSRMDVYESQNWTHQGDFVRLDLIPCETFVPIYDYGPVSH